MNALKPFNPVDLSDELSPILDQMRVIWVALHGTGVLSDDMIAAAANVLNDAANDLENVIDRLCFRVKGGADATA